MSESEQEDTVKAAFNRVVDERSFVDFLEALGNDWEDERAKEKNAPSNPHGHGANGWENVSFGAILEAAVASWRDNADTRQSASLRFGGNIWKAAAHILFCGKYYE